MCRLLCAIALVCAVACKNNSGATPDCNNHITDGNETDVDCGGPMCGACGTGKKCKRDADCFSRLCNSDGVCSAPSCSDGVLNGSESDIDCGGPDCGPCPDGKKCAAGNDCVSMACNYDGGICEGCDGDGGTSCH
jgi:hypothetical protein